MNRRIISCVVIVFSSLIAIAQQTSTNVPRLVRFNGIITQMDGTPRTGVVGILFSLYAEQQGGNALWTELQNVALDANGQYTVLLGSQHAEGVPAELFTSNEARWLGIQVEAEPELSRILLVSVPYALKAGDAETLGGLPASAFLLNRTTNSRNNATSTITSTQQPVAVAAMQTNSVNTVTNGGTANYLARWLDSSTLGNSLLYDNGSQIAIGSASPRALFQISAGLPRVFITATTLGNNAGLQFEALPSNNALPAVRGGLYYAPGNSPDTTFFGMSADDTTYQMVVNQSGNIGMGTSAPAERLHVVAPKSRVFVQSTGNGNNAALRVGGISTGSVVSSGGLYYQPGDTAATTFFGVSADDATYQIVANKAGNVGIGTSSPTQKLEVAGNVKLTGGSMVFNDNSVQSSAGVTGVNASAGVNGSIGNGLLTLTGDTTYLQKRIAGTCSSGTAVGTVNADGSVTCNAVTGGGGSITPPLVLSADIAGGGSDPSKVSILYAANTDAGTANPDPITNFPATAIAGFATNTNATGFTVGVVGRSDAPVGVGVIGIATGVGTQNDRATAVTAFATSTTGRTKALEASINSPNGTVMSVKGPSGATLIDAGTGTISGSSGTSIFHVDSGNASFTVPSFSINNGAGSTNVSISGPVTIQGNLNVSGTVSKQSGSFKIDHPLDPTNKFLYHSFVESPDMLNVYNGIVTLDARGRAWVQLPDYFEALNQDFRYQLTAVGAPGPNLYIATEISGNRFRIAGGKAHAKVSWQVTGIRHDAYANAHRIQVEVDKGSERGTYIHPELFGHETDAVASRSTTTTATSASSENH